MENDQQHIWGATGRDCHRAAWLQAVLRAYGRHKDVDVLVAVVVLVVLFDLDCRCLYGLYHKNNAVVVQNMIESNSCMIVLL